MSGYGDVPYGDAPYKDELPSLRYWFNHTSGYWSDTSNWADSTDSTTGGAAVPGQSDEVYFNPGSGTCIVDITVRIKSLTMTDGTMDFNGRSFSINRNLVVQDDAIFLTSGLNSSVIHIRGDSSIIGKADHYMNLMATAPWMLTVDRSGSATYVNISNSNAGHGSPIHAYHSGDGLFNNNWIFHPDIPPNSTNYFTKQPARDNYMVISKIVPEVLLLRTAAAGGLDYFDSTSKIKRVDILFWDSSSRESKRIIHTGTSLEGKVTWTTGATPGVWRALQARVVDTDGAELFIERNILEGYQDFTMA